MTNNYITDTLNPKCYFMSQIHKKHGITIFIKDISSISLHLTIKDFPIQVYNLNKYLAVHNSCMSCIYLKRAVKTYKTNKIGCKEKHCTYHENCYNLTKNPFAFEMFENTVRTKMSS